MAPTLAAAEAALEAGRHRGAAACRVQAATRGRLCRARLARDVEARALSAAADRAERERRKTEHRLRSEVSQAAIIALKRNDAAGLLQPATLEWLCRAGSARAGVARAEVEAAARQRSTATWPDGR